jgi:hypothetical protein
MKKLLIVLLAAMMVLSLAAVSMAATTVGGELKMIYKTDDVKTNDEAEWYDAAEAKVTATTQVSDSVAGFVAIKTGDGANGGFKADEYHITFTQDFGTVKVGYFGHKLTPSLDIIKGWGFKEMKGNALTEANFNIADGFVLGLAYALDGNTGNEVGDLQPLYDGAYDVKFGYATDLFGGEVHVFGNGDCKNDEIESVNALDVWYQPMDMLKAYVAYVDAGFKGPRKDPDAAIIVGALAQLTDAFSARFEYNIEEYGTKPDTYNNYGLKLAYAFGNGVTAEFKTEHKWNKDAKGANLGGEVNAMELSMKVAL